MDRSTRWKSLFLLLLLALSVAALLPSVVETSRLPAWYADVFSKKVKLGLDLKGGLRIVYGLDIDKAVVDKATALRRDLETRLAEQKITASVETPLADKAKGIPNGTVIVVGEPDAVKAASSGKFLDEYEDQLEKIRCPKGREGQLCLRVASDYVDRMRDQAIAEAVRIIGDRVDRYGVAEPTIIRKGDDIIVELPGRDEKEHERLRSIINKTAQLTFKLVDNGTEYMNNLYIHVKEDPRAVDLGIEAMYDRWQHDESGDQFTDAYLQAKNVTKKLTREEIKPKYRCSETPDRDGRYECEISGRTIIEEYLGTLPPNLQPDDKHEIGYEEETPDETEDDKTPRWRTYYLIRTAELGGTEIADAGVTWDPTTNRPEVLVRFNSFGARRFGDITTKNVGKKLAIILDERVTSAPILQSPITNGRASISMGGSGQRMQTEANDLSNVLKTGSLPAPLEEKSSSKVGAMLGQDAIDRAQLAMIVGSIMVILLMLYFYKVSGFIANVAMVFNVLFQMAILAAFQATLTLPGIAGIVLTIGMAVDSNIIIYERIREELRDGKSVRGAVDAGFSRAFWTVFDAHVTNFVAGFVLLEYGTGPIRGFAVMLLIGVVCNLFTSTWVSRLMFEYYLGRKQRQTISI